MSCGVPQGSCLGLPLFKIYASKLFEIIEGYLPQAHAYADDTQLCASFKADLTCVASVSVVLFEALFAFFPSVLRSPQFLRRQKATNPRTGEKTYGNACCVG